MDSRRDDSSSDERETSLNTNNSQDKKYHRHSNFQTERLEAYFKECPHPDETQRQEFGDELNLTPKQIKFWFQNKRTQTKAQNERADNAALKAKNMRIRGENEAMKTALDTVVCPPCGGPLFGKEARELRLQKFRSENAALKSDCEKLKSYVDQLGGHSVPNGHTLTNIRGQPSTSTDNRYVLYGSSSQNPLETPRVGRPYTHENMNINRVPQPPKHQRTPMQIQHFPPLSEVEKMTMSEKALNAVSEVMKLIQAEEPMWVKSSIDGRLFIDQEEYEKLFKLNQFRSQNARAESSKEVVVVPMDARTLIDVFYHTEKWARVFPTIVNESKTIHVLESMDQEGHNFLQLVYEQLHILSPLVPPREFMVLRYCKKIEDNLWVIADVSHNLPSVDFEFETPVCFKRPSGIIIQALPDGRSKVTWIEHVEIEDKVRQHRLYKELLGGGSGYGARRWTVTLERMCERLTLSWISDFSPTDFGGVVKTTEGRKSVMNLGERMMKNFAWTLKMSKKLDFSQLSEFNNSGVRVSVRVNKQVGQPSGLVVCACSSLCLSLSPLQVYNFLQDTEKRHEWDVLFQTIPAAEVARFATGTDPKNRVTVFQPTKPTGETVQMMLIQDAFMDALGGMVVYAPIDINTAYSAILGQVDPATIAILPTGFVISQDGRPTPTAQLDGGLDNCTTLLTVAFQILVSGGPTIEHAHINQSVTTVNTLVSSTVQRIKGMLNCDEAK